MKCTKLLSCRQFLQEFHYSRFWFTSTDWRSLVYIPWLPYKWPFQIIHVIYRWVVAFYFLGWLIASGVQFQRHGARWLIFLTNWSIVGFVVYLILAALSVTAKFITVHTCKKSDYQDSLDRTSDYQFKKPNGCCGYGSNQLSWYQMIHWASFSICAEIALVVSILYWVLLYTGGTIDGVDANTHLVNGIVSLMDVLVFGMPISFLHFIYPMLFTGVYSGFTGIYYGANGTHPDSGGRYVYRLLDYGSQPTISSVIVILVVFLFVPIIHLVYYALYLARFWLVYAIYGRSKVSCWGNQRLANEGANGVELKSV